MRPRLLAAIGAFLVAGSLTASAQTATFTAVIEKATLPSFCQEETHFVDCNGTLLKSTTLDLDLYVGKPFEYTATLGGVECKIWNVTKVVAAKATLVQCGNPVPGCPMRLRVGPTGVIGQWFLWYSGAPDFQPVDPVLGTIMLAAPWQFVASGPTFGSGAAHDFVLPTAPGLTGLDVFVQGARMDVGPVGPLTLTNPTCFTILGPSPPCFQVDC